MAWGFFNKIKNGFKKAFNFGKKVVKTVADKVIKPFKPIIGTIASAFNPALGAAVNVGMNAVEKVADGDYKGALGWGKQF